VPPGELVAHCIYSKLQINYVWRHPGQAGTLAAEPRSVRHAARYPEEIAP
jgi:hypothetical protein